MAKRGKDFNIPANLFDKQFWTTFEATAVNEYRKVIFDKSNPRMSNDKNFPSFSEYSKSYKEAKSKGEMETIQILMLLCLLEILC